MFKTLKTIAAELKRANDLKERDIKNKETWGWYNQSHTVYVEPAASNNFTGRMTYYSTTEGRNNG